jgi:hypothetical protein
MHRIFNRISLILLMLVLVVSAACNEGPGSVELRDGSGDEPLRLHYNEVHDLASPYDREALLLFLDGHITLSGVRSVEISHVLDAPVYAGPDDPQGDPHWITRSRVLDADGQTLWTQRVNSLFQLLEFLNVIIEEASPISISAAQVYELAAEEYPELIQFPVKIPHQLRGAHRYILDIQEEDGSWTELASYEIEELKEMAQPPSPDFEFEIETLVDSGPPSDRLNIAILGDGYTEEERHIFEGDAQAVAERFLETTPMVEHADLFNIHTVWTPSAESGAGYDCNRPNAPAECEQDFRDTIFETVFVIPALADRYGLPLGDVSDRVAMPVQLGRIFEVASLAHYDEIIFLSNSQKRSGFAGLYVALVTNFDDRINFPDVAVHEVGHTLGLLGDEYMVSGDACYFNEPIIPLPANIGLLGADTMKWEEWLKEDTPLPTEPHQAGQYPVGAYEGAYNCDFLYRPSLRCKMNRSTDEFCSVCSEQMVRRFYTLVDPLLNEPVRARLNNDDSLVVTLPIRDEERYVVDWLIDRELQIEQGPNLQISSKRLTSQRWTTVSATVRNASDFVRKDEQLATSTVELELRLID